MYHKVLTVDLSPHISRVLPSLGRFGSLRAQVGLGFAVVGWFRRVRLPPPPPLVFVRFPSASAFLFPWLFRVCPFRAGVLVLVFSPSPLLFAFPFSCPG